ncbi:hypothetical protein A7U60_g8499 [Sanghuangporus baumii]|uniref:DUF6697 domain-containing protein n=1 Tax=Sanghuangporus baumii TaxID=108892 RepID=A0A9Q5N4M7_SANBA|nr:hypothetical protein A7U60_g8499 [Sanghuangporus baumii]
MHTRFNANLLEQTRVGQEGHAIFDLEQARQGEAQRSPSPESPGSAIKRDPSIDVANAHGSANDEPVVRKEEPEDDIAAFMAERENVRFHSTHPDNIAEETIYGVQPIFKKIKKKDELFALPADTVYNIITQIRLKDVTLPEIDLRVRDTFVSRYLISDMLGGSPQDTFPTPRPEKITEHGIKSYLCLVYSFNPFAPQLPGKSGLFFGLTRRGLSAAEREKHSMVYPYFIRIDANKWHYLGHYEFKGGRPLSVEEWRQQSPLCKRTWIRDVATCKGFTKYRAYIRLRRGLEEDEEVKSEAVKKMEINMSVKKRLDDISLDEIETAFDRGHLLIDAQGMQCVRYDAAFQQSLYAHSLNWSASSKKQATTPRRRKRNSKAKVESSSDSDSDVQIVSVSARKSKSASPSKKRTSRHRRRRSVDTSSSLSDDGDSVDAMDIDNLEDIRERSSSYVPRGTRSRPAKRVKAEISLV